MHKSLIIAMVLAGIAVIVQLVPAEHGEAVWAAEIGDRPVTPWWERAIPHQTAPEGLNSLSAELCGRCHADHYAEWKVSTHAHAWTDIQFQAELKKDSSPYLCVNCHTPLQNQQEFIVTGLYSDDIYQPVRTTNPAFDPRLRSEGITCAACHVRDGAIVGPTGTPDAPHRTVRDIKHLSETLCISCHNATDVLTPQLVCAFETGDEWKQSPYESRQSCIDCHMPSVERSFTDGQETRSGRRHYFQGSGIPKVAGSRSESLTALEFFADTLRQSYQIDETVHYELIVRNQFAGHDVPTGSPERFLLFVFTLHDEHGAVIARAEETIGQEWEWYPEAVLLSENRLGPLETRSIKFSHDITASGKYRLDIEVTKHRMEKKDAEYHNLGDDYPLSVSLFRDSQTLVVM